MDFHLYFSFALKWRQCGQFVLRIFQVKVFGPKGWKFLATKSKNLGASWLPGFFLKSSPEMKYCPLDSKYITLKVLVCMKNNAIAIIHATIYHTSRCLHSHGRNSFRFLYCFRWWNRHIRYFWEYPLSFLELKVLPVE